MTRILRTIAAAAVAVCVAGSSLAAQAYEPSARLREVLPKEVADRVIARIAAAQARELPAQALENRALKFAARGVKPEDIERAISEHATRMDQAKQALESARAKRPSNDEIEASAEAIRMGAVGADVSAVAKKGSEDRSLVVAFNVLTALSAHVDVAEALDRVTKLLEAGVSDAEIERLPASLPAQAAEGKSRKPAVVGRDLAATKRPGTAGPPSGVPADAGVRPPVQPPISRP